MSEAGTKPRSVGLKFLIGALVLALLATGSFLGYSLVLNWFLKVDAKRFASEAGIDRARDNFVRGRLVLYEIKLLTYRGDEVGRVPAEGGTEPTGRREGSFEIRFFFVDGQVPSVHVEIVQAMVGAHNQRMRAYIEKPDWFDTDGNRVARPTKTPRTSVETNSPPLKLPN